MATCPSSSCAMHAVARTARELGMRLKKHEAEFAAEDDDQDEDEEGGAAGGKALWGASKRAYHGADAADVRTGLQSFSRLEFISACQTVMYPMCTKTLCSHC